LRNRQSCNRIGPPARRADAKIRRVSGIPDVGGLSGVGGWLLWLRDYYGTEIRPDATGPALMAVSQSAAGVAIPASSANSRVTMTLAFTA
jgi:hypothetical protein